MARRRLLVLAQVLAVAAAASLILAASPVSIHTTATAPSSPAIPRAAVASVFRGARRLGPRHHLRRLSELPSSDTEPPADTAPDADAPAPAPAPAHDDADDDREALALVAAIAFVPVVFLGFAAGSALLALLIFILRKGTALLASSVSGLYAAATAAGEKATRVRPLDAAGP